MEGRNRSGHARLPGYHSTFMQTGGALAPPTTTPALSPVPLPPV